jgi:hypothetical protein
MSQPVQLFAVVVLVSFPTVMDGGYALLRLLKTDPPTSSGGPTAKWVACIPLEAGVLTQSGGPAHPRP